MIRRLLGFVLATVCFSILVSALMPSKAIGYSDEIIVYSIYAGQEKSFRLPPKQIVEVYFRPMKAGNWNFFAWHSSMIGFRVFPIVEFYWRDGPRDVWHHWRTSSFDYNIWTHQHLYSGSSSIEYKFVFGQFTDFGIQVNLVIE